jgi:hypothetical protein
MCCRRPPRIETAVEPHPPIALECCSRTSDPHGAFRRQAGASSESRVMEELLKVFDDDLLTAVQSVVEFLVCLLR